MLQYLLNTSIIWLACLLFYDLLLRRESFHRYNRVFLLGSLAAGLLLPGLNFDELSPLTHYGFSDPAAPVYRVRKAIQVSALQGTQTPAVSTQYILEFLLWALYFAGAVTGIFLLGREVMRLIRLYRNGKTFSERGTLIVETGKQHSPFSFFNMVFVSHRQDYNATQWTLLLAHEQEHGRRLHSLDNLLLLLLRIIFWFHPLPHLYYKRIRMLHEFQADEAAAGDIAGYGSFLVEQSLLQRVPLLTHSFHYSPIKTRIAMLTQTRSKRNKMLKYLCVFPLSLGFVLFCTAHSLSNEASRKGGSVLFKGREVTFAPLKIIPFSYRKTIEQQKAMFLQPSLPDSVITNDFGTGKVRMEAVRSDTMPVAINGKLVYGNEEQYLLPEADKRYTPPVFGKSANTLDAYIFSRLSKELDQLEDGVYMLRLNRIVIGEDGRVAYYEPEGLSIFMGPYEKKPVINASLRHIIDRKLVDIIESAADFKPALKDGKPVNVRVGMGNYLVIVKDHKARLEERGGC